MRWCGKLIYPKKRTQKIQVARIHAGNQSMFRNQKRSEISVGWILKKGSRSALESSGSRSQTRCFSRWWWPGVKVRTLKKDKRKKNLWTEWVIVFYFKYDSNHHSSPTFPFKQSPCSHNYHWLGSGWLQISTDPEVPAILWARIGLEVVWNAWQKSWIYPLVN